MTPLHARLRTAFAALSIALVAPSLARAQDDGDDEARVRFQAGRLAFDAGRFEEALADFQRAYELSHRTLLLYNIGLSLDRLDRGPEALETFQRYLASNPPSENRGAVERRVQILRARMEGRSLPPGPAGGSSGPDPLGLSLIIGGSVVAVVGAILLGAGISDRSSVENAMDGVLWSDIAGAADRAPIFETIGIVSLVAGAAAAGLGIVMLATSGGPSRQASLRFRITPLALRLEGAF